MAITRKPNNKVDAKPWEVIIDEIDRTLSDINSVFSLAFSGGVSAPQGLHAQRAGLFSDIWCGLSLDLATFHSIEELNTYYTVYLKNLNVYIKSYCDSESIPAGGVSEEQITVLKELAKIYYSLARQKFILKLFRNGDEMNDFTLAFLNLQNADAKLQKDLAMIKPESLEQTLMAINLVFNEVINGFKSKGFGEIEIDLPLENLSKSQDIDLRNIRAIIARIPSADSINQTIDLVGKGSGHEKKMAQTELKQIARTTESVVQDLGEIISADLKSQAQDLYLLLQKCDAIDKQFSSLRQQFEKVDVFPLIIQLWSYPNATLKINMGYASLLQLAKSSFEACDKVNSEPSLQSRKAWENAKNQLRDTLPKIATEVGVFVQPFGKHLKDWQEMNLSLVSASEKQKQINELRMVWASRLIKAEDAWKKCCEATLRAQSTLLTHAESNTDYIKSFFAHNKLKMILGGAGGTGTGITLSGLLFTFELLSTTVLIGSGALVGLGLGALLAFSIDHYRRVKTGHSENEVVPEAKNIREQISQHMFTNLPFMSDAELGLSAEQVGSINAGKKEEVADSFLPKLPELPSLPSWLPFQSRSSNESAAKLAQTNSSLWAPIPIDTDKSPAPVVPEPNVSNSYT